MGAAYAEDDESEADELYPRSITLDEERPQLPAPRRSIDEIVVTAQKTEQSLQDVPVSVTAMDGDFIRDSGANDLTELSAYVPNVRVDTDDPGSPQVFIRGFGTNTFNVSFEPSVGFVQDEVFFARGGYFTEAMFDIGRIEVLRGPQGTLFGKNTIAGVFNVLSRAPGGELAADLAVTIADYGERRIEGGFGGPLSDRIGVRLSFLDWQRDGRTENSLLDRLEDKLDQSAGRLRLDWQPLDGLAIDLIAVTSETTINFWPFQLKALDDDTRDYLEDFDPEIEDDPHDFQTSFDRAGVLRKGSDTYSLKADWDLGPRLGLEHLGSVLVVADSTFFIRQDNDLDVSPADISTLLNNEDYDQQSLEWRFTGGAESLFGLGDGVDFIAGLFAFRSGYQILADVVAGEDLGSYALTEDAQQLLTAEAGGESLGNVDSAGVLNDLLRLGGGTVVGEDFYHFDFTQDVEALALFGQLSLDLGERWVLTPGIRFNRESKTAVPTGTAVCQSKPVTQNCVMQTLIGANDYAPGTLRRSETDISPKLSLMYYLRDDISTFFTWSRGFKSGGVNAISFTGENLEFEPENAHTYELGLKSRLLDRSLSLNITAYRTEFDNLQVLAFNGLFFDVSNAAKAYSQGLEMDALWLTPFEPLTINASLGLLDARYDEYPGAPAPVSEGLNEVQDLAGRRLAFAPKVTATLSPSLRLPLGDAMGLRLTVDILHQGQQFTDVDLDPATSVPATTTYSARLSLAGQNESWALTIGGKNLTDERYLNQVTDAPFFPGTYFVQQQAGRVGYVNLRLDF